MQCFGAFNALEDRHSIATHSTNITVVQWTSKMQRIGINIFKQLFSIVFFNTFRMEIFSTIGSWAFSDLIFTFRVLWNSWFLTLFTLFLWFSFFIFFILSTIIQSFILANQASNQIRITIRTAPISIQIVFKCLIVKTQFSNIILRTAFKWSVTLVLHFSLTLFMEWSFTKIFAKYSTFWFIAKWT